MVPGGDDVRRVAVGLAKNSRSPALAERAGESVAEPLVVGLQMADASGGRFQAAQQRRVGGALPLRRRGGGMLLAEPLDLGAQVLLGVESGARDAGLSGDSVETDPLAGGVHVPQRGDRALAGLLSPSAGCRDDVV